ncbi:hypothetical protein [Nocardia suismassiliense]|uniref:hypothetical protein n=1 Tax=Nocardia suismassiliense TaxID=2077092 RepID=UPI000D1DA17E|nr:hypothetical protein [Nocardia suismassiliense]
MKNAAPSALKPRKKSVASTVAPITTTDTPSPDPQSDAEIVNTWVSAIEGYVDALSDTRSRLNEFADAARASRDSSVDPMLFGADFLGACKRRGIIALPVEDVAVLLGLARA